MLRDPTIWTLNRVLITCREAADQYAAATSIIEKEITSRRFRAYRHARKCLADDLEEIMRRYGWFPREPDPEREALQSLWLRFKAVLAQNEIDVLPGEVKNIESSLQQRVSDAMREEVPEETMEILKTLDGEVSRTMDEMDWF